MIRSTRYRRVRFFCPIVLLLNLTAPAEAADPDFSGKWHLDKMQSKIRPMPQPPAQFLEIKHEGPKVQCQGRREAPEPLEDCSFTTDRKPSLPKPSHVTRKTVAKWEGSALLLNTIVIMGNSQHSEMDRWKLSRDSKTLTIRKQVVGPRGEIESTLYYELKN